MSCAVSASTFPAFRMNPSKMSFYFSYHLSSKMLGIKCLLVCLIILNASGYQRKKLDCDLMYKKEGLVCIIFDLEVYSKLTRITELSIVLEHSTFIGVYIMSPNFYYLPNRIFKHFSEIKELKIISDVPTLLELDGKEINNLKKLRSIQIIGQKIRRLEDNTFQGAPGVTSLYLPYNQIETIHPRAFSGMYELLFLVLSHNRIRSLNARLFAELPKLWSLNLENNRLIRFSEDSFGNSPVTVCDLSYNLLPTSPYKPVVKVLESNSSQMVLFSVRENLCPYMTRTIFHRRSRPSDVKKIIEKCSAEFTGMTTPKPLPRFCYSTKCHECVRDVFAAPNVVNRSMDNEDNLQSDEVDGDQNVLGEREIRNYQQQKFPEVSDDHGIINLEETSSEKIDRLIEENARLRKTMADEEFCYPKSSSRSENVETDLQIADEPKDPKVALSLIKEEQELLIKQQEEMMKMIEMLESSLNEIDETKLPEELPVNSVNSSEDPFIIESEESAINTLETNLDDDSNCEEENLVHEDELVEQHIEPVLESVSNSDDSFENELKTPEEAFRIYQEEKNKSPPGFLLEDSFEEYQEGHQNSGSEHNCDENEEPIDTNQGIDPEKELFGGSDEELQSTYQSSASGTDCVESKNLAELEAEQGIDPEKELFGDSDEDEFVVDKKNPYEGVVNIVGDLETISDNTIFEESQTEYNSIIKEDQLVGGAWQENVQKVPEAFESLDWEAEKTSNKETSKDILDSQVSSIFE